MDADADDDSARGADHETNRDAGRAGRVRSTFGAALVWTVWAGATLALISYIHHYARNVPFFEDLTIVPVMTAHDPLTYEWVTAQYNEHRNVVPRLIQVGLLRVVPDFRAGLYLNAALLSAAAGGAVLLARRLRGRIAPVDVVLPLAILTPGQNECLLVGFALNLVATGVIAWGLIAVLCDSSNSSPLRTCLLVGGALVLLPLCGGSGMAMLPPLALWLAGFAACGWWTGRAPDPRVRAVGAVLLSAASATVAWYLHGYVRPANVPRASSWSAVVSTTLETLSLVLSPVGWSRPVAAGAVVAILAAVTAGLLAARARNSAADRPRALGMLAVLASTLGVAVAVGYSRSGLGPGSGAYGRYVTLMTPMLGVVYFSWTLYGRPSARRAVQFGLLCLIGLGTPAQDRYARDFGRVRRDLHAGVERGIEAGMRPAELADLACPNLFPDRDTIHRCFLMLKAARVGAFAHMADDAEPKTARAVSERMAR